MNWVVLDRLNDSYARPTCLEALSMVTWSANRVVRTGVSRSMIRQILLLVNVVDSNVGMGSLVCPTNVTFVYVEISSTTFSSTY